MGYAARQLAPLARLREGGGRGRAGKWRQCHTVTKCSLVWLDAEKIFQQPAFFRAALFFPTGATAFEQFAVPIQADFPWPLLHHRVDESCERFRKIVPRAGGGIERREIGRRESGIHIPRLGQGQFCPEVITHIAAQ